MNTLSSSDLELLELLAKLVRISSVNPNYSDGVPELECANFVHDYLASFGIEVWRQEVFENRPNVLARLKGKDRSKQIVFEAHMDTVSTVGMSIDPFLPTIEHGKLYGRGACDTKAGLAAMMHALTCLARRGSEPACDILLAATIDEEFSYRGVLAVCAGMEPRRLHQPHSNEKLRADLAVIAEPTNLRLVVASKGVLRWKIDTLGIAAHSSKPHLGRNAIVDMVQVIETLQQDTNRLAATSHPLLGAATLNIGVIRGGVQVNFVPDRCTIEVDRRLLPGESWQTVFEHYQALMSELMVRDPDMRIEMQSPMLTDLPLECEIDSPQVGKVREVLRSLNLVDEPIGVPFGSDASKFAAIGIPSVILGPGSIDQAHAAVEFVDCREVVVASEVYQRLMLA